MSETEADHATAGDAHDDGHGHGPSSEPLGPVDLMAWAYAAGGALLGLMAALALYVARGS